MSATAGVCERCGGSGWVITERNGISGANRCECRAQARNETILERANIPPNYRNSSFENFVLPKDNPLANAALGKVMVTVKSYAREFPALPKPGLFFAGNPGVGKTHLAVAALRMLIARGFEGVFYDYQSLLDQIRSGWDPMMQLSSRETYQRALESELLVLDDLGAHRVTEFVEDTVTSIITYRCNNNKATIITTNLPDPDAGGAAVERSAGKTDYRITLAERIGMRARSRIFEMCRVIAMPAVQDYRLKKQ